MTLQVAVQAPVGGGVVIPLRGDRRTHDLALGLVARGCVGGVRHGCREQQRGGPDDSGRQGCR
ncbi:hypothetical protein ACFQ7M_02205 [Streptomyces massasporeus]